jgi:hypothetical protein
MAKAQGGSAVYLVSLATSRRKQSQRAREPSELKKIGRENRAARARRVANKGVCGHGVPGGSNLGRHTLIREVNPSSALDGA